MLDQAAKVGIAADSDEEVIGNLLQQEVNFNDVDEASCRDFYDNNPSSFTQGEMAAASHILFTAGEGLSGSLVKAKAEGILAGIAKEPSSVCGNGP